MTDKLPIETNLGEDRGALRYRVRRDLGLVVEHVDLVARRQQAQDLGAVVGDTRGRRGQRGDERQTQAGQRRARSTYSCGP